MIHRLGVDGRHFEFRAYRNGLIGVFCNGTRIAHGRRHTVFPLVKMAMLMAWMEVDDNA